MYRIGLLIMDLNDLNIDVGEFIFIGDFCIYRNDYAYIVFTLSKSNDDSSNNYLLINDNYYRVTTVEDLRTYRLDDF